MKKKKTNKKKVVKKTKPKKVKKVEQPKKVKKAPYSLSSFTFRVKKPIKYSNYFKEVEVSFVYKEKRIIYHYFVDKAIANYEAIKLAKKKMETLIKEKRIIRYAKKYFHRVY